jgi:hypothetical protein
MLIPATAQSSLAEQRHERSSIPKPGEGCWSWKVQIMESAKLADQIVTGLECNLPPIALTSKDWMLFAVPGNELEPFVDPIEKVVGANVHMFDYYRGQRGKFSIEAA